MKQNLGQISLEHKNRHVSSYHPLNKIGQHSQCQAAHLGSAFTIYSGLVWVGLNLMQGGAHPSASAVPRSAARKFTRLLRFTREPMHSDGGENFVRGHSSGVGL